MERGMDPEKIRKLWTSLAVPSVQEMAKQRITEVPERYIRPNQDATVPYDTISLLQIPVIDLSNLLSQDATELDKFDRACKEWGFFQLINHGVNPSLVEDMKKNVEEFFNLPMEEKKELWQKARELEGFGQVFVVSEEHKVFVGQLQPQVTLHVLISDKTKVDEWFNTNVGPLDKRKTTLDPALVTAEEGPPKIVKVMQDGSGEFKTITDALDSIPSGNTKRVILYIGAGNYNEKIKIERTKPFVTFYGVPEKMPNLTFGGTAQQYGTVDSATLIVESDYFVAANIIISNSAPRPDGKRPGAQAVALRISGDKAAFYNCQVFGFQDTICDDRNRHFFKDCLIQGTVDYIFGSGKSLYLKTELRTLGDTGITVITAQARKGETEDNGYSFVHCDVTGTGKGTFLGRAWMSHPKVIFAYSTMSDIVNKEGWSNNNHPEYDKSAYFGEFQNTGPGADPKGRAPITKQLVEADIKPFITLGMIEGSKWLLPPPTLKV